MSQEIHPIILTRFPNSARKDRFQARLLLRFKFQRGTAKIVIQNIKHALE